MKTVAVIIPTKNGGAYIESLLSALFRQSFPPTQVIVVDSGSRDGTVEIAKKFPVKLIQIPPFQFDHGGTRNMAVSFTNEEFIVFLTQDALPSGKDFLRNLLSPFDEDEKIAAVYGRHLPREDADPIERFSRNYNYGNEPLIKSLEDVDRIGIKAFFITNVCSAIKRKAFDEVNGFPERCIVNEEMIFAAKLLKRGYKIRYEPSASVIHSHRYGITDYFRRYFDIGVSLAMNKWIVEIAPPYGEGKKYFKNLLKFLWEERKLGWIIKAFFVTAAKFLGFQLGLLYKKIPLFLARKFSMHSYFFKRSS